MGIASTNSEHPRQANFRLCNVSGYMTELLELQAENPAFHVLFIPGNPGIVKLYEMFLEALYQQLGGKASVTAVGHICHTSKDWEQGRVFSLEDQILHKMDFIDHKLETRGIPIVLVGHSIGAHISLQLFKRAPHKVLYYIGLYPFLALNAKSQIQNVVGKLSKSPVLSLIASLFVALLGLLPIQALRFIVEKSSRKAWAPVVIDVFCAHLFKYHIMRNILFMRRTEYEEFSEAPDWDFMRARRDKIALLLSTDDHWGPLSLFDEIAKGVPGLGLSIEREGHTHEFECSEAGSLWAAKYAASLIRKHVSTN